MAATLVEGQKYGLDSNDSTRGKKTIIHFKLTDSAFRAIEEFSRIKEGCSRKPTIQFTNNTGVMCIPGQVSSDDPKAERCFHLTTAKLVGDANGSFDCIQQTRNRHGTGLSCLGSMQYKVSTKANNDVYSDTRKKIAIADNESKKICAKEIKMKGRFSGKKIKKMIPSSQYNAGKPASSSSSSSSSSSFRGGHHTSSSSLLASSSSLLSSTSAASSSRLPSAPSSSSGSSHALGGEGGRLSSKTTLGRVTSIVSSNNGILQIGNGSGSNGEKEKAYGFPIKQRVVHLLALRTYKKPELVVRLMKGGIHENDRSTLDSVVKEVSVMAKDGRYTLAKHAWQYFRPDWPLYSAIDKQLAQRNQQVAESRSSTSPMAAAVVSPAVNSTHSPSPPQAPKKRVKEDPADQMFVSKKRRIAHHPTSSRQHTTTTNSGPSLANSSTLPLTSGVTTVHHYSHRTGGGSTGSMSQGSDCGIDSVSTIASSGSSGKDDSPLPESPQYNCENQGKGDDSSLQEDYMLQYRKIVTCKQRLQYKEDFNKEFEEYRHLHDKLTVVAEKFKHLRECISNTQEGSETYKGLFHQVLEEYKKCKSDSEFQLRRRRVDYLHDKLSYIKQRIIDYDLDTHLNQCS